MSVDKNFFLKDMNFNIIIVSSIACATDISVLYYSAKPSAGQRDICYHCGSNNVIDIPPKLLEEFRSVHPVCDSCRSQGIDFHKRLPCKREI